MIIDWIKHNLGVTFVLLAGGVVGSILFIFLQPGEPNLPAYRYSESGSADYQPGGRSCELITLAAIADRAKALSERERCAEAAEEYRLKSNDLVQQARTADATAAQTILSYDLARVALLGTIIGLWTLIAASLAAYFARNAAYAARDSYRAFVKVEDASLVPEFPSGGMVESVVEGVKQPDTYFLKVVVTNIGRSTARIHGWTVGDGKFERREHTLKAGDTWKPGSEISFITPDGNFALAIHYSSTLRERMRLEVAAKLRTRKLQNGGTHYSGRVKSTQAKDDLPKDK